MKNSAKYRDFVSSILRIVCFPLLYVTVSFTLPFPNIAKAQCVCQRPLSDFAGPSETASDFLTPVDEGNNFLQKVKVTDYNFENVEDNGNLIGTKSTVETTIDSPTDFTIRGLKDFVIRLDGQSPTFTFEQHDVETPSPETNFRFKLEIDSMDVSLVYKGDKLKPIKKVQNGSEVTFVEYDGTLDVQPEFSTSGKITIQYNWGGGVAFSVTDPVSSGEVAFSVSTPMMIGETGVVLDVADIQLHLSDRDDAPPVGDLPTGWRGVMFSELGVHFTGPLAGNKFDQGAGITLKDFAIGDGGVSGEMIGSNLSRNIKLGGSDFILDNVNIKLRQNSFVHSKISGTFEEFPFFEEDIDLDLSIDNKGDIFASIAPGDRDGALKTLAIAGVADLDIDSLDVEFINKIVYMTVNGALTPKFGGNITAKANSPIPINGLRVSTKGDVEIQGGWPTLPQKATFDAFKAFELEVAQFSFGTDPGDAGSSTSQPERQWMGFTGAVDLAKLGGYAEFDQLVFSWDKGSSGQNLKASVKRIKVDYEQKGVVSFNGELGSFENDDNCGFIGQLLVDLKGPGIKTDADLVVGQTSAGTLGGCGSANATGPPPTKFFYLDLEAHYASGLPVFSNVSIYSFLGLFANNMEPDIYAFDKPLCWFRSHRKAGAQVLESHAPGGPCTEGGKPPWKVQQGSLALAAGIGAGTTADQGYSANLKAALMVVTPGPILMITGAGNVLRKPLDFDDKNSDPLFEALAIFDNRQKTFLVNLGVYFKKPANSGSLVDITATSELYANLADPTDWHFYMGEDDPESRRIRATVIKFLKANAYFMLEPNSLAFGYWAGFDSRPKYKFGPLKAQLAAWFSFKASLSRRPNHAMGNVDLGGLVDLKAFGIGIGLTANADLGFESPTPFILAGEFNVKLKTPKFIPDPGGTVKLKWEKYRPLPAPGRFARYASLEDSISAASTPAFLNTTGNTMISSIVNMNSLCSPQKTIAEGTKLDDCKSPWVPLTYKPSISFDRSVNDKTSNPGNGSFALVGNNLNDTEQVRGSYGWKFNVNALHFKGARKGQDYSASLDYMPNVYGAWPALPGTASSSAATTVSLWSKNPFEIYDASTFLFYEDGKGGYQDWFTDAYDAYPCLVEEETGVLNDVANTGLDIVKGVTKAVSDAVDAIGNALPGANDDCDCDENSGDGDVGDGSADDGSDSPGRDVVDQISDLQEGLSPTSECLDPDVITAEDLVLPPYHVFAVQTDTQAVGVGNASSSNPYKQTFYFHTEGPSWRLEPFVEYNIPSGVEKRHYREDFVGLRFNQTWMDLLYRDPAPGDDSPYTGPDQKFVFRIIDENNAPVAHLNGNGQTITTLWDEADDHTRSPSEEKFLSFMDSKNINVSAASNERDDMAFGQLDDWQGFLPGKRYTVEVWFEDPRIAFDKRDDDAWLEANNILHLDRDRNAVLLHSFPLQASLYGSFEEMIKSHSDGWWEIPSSGISNQALQNMAQKVAVRSTFQNGSVSNASAEKLARYLRLANPTISPDSLNDETLQDLVAKTPNYDGDATQLSEAQVADIKSIWTDDAELFSEIDSIIGADRVREPLPNETEISAITDAQGRTRAILVEFAEEAHWSRIDLKVKFKNFFGFEVTESPAVLIDRAGTRAYLMRTNAAAFPRKELLLEHKFFKKHGDRNPVLRSDTGEIAQTATIAFDLSDAPLQPEGR